MFKINEKIKSFELFSWIFEYVKESLFLTETERIARWDVKFNQTQTEKAAPMVPPL